MAGGVYLNRNDLLRHVLAEIAAATGRDPIEKGNWHNCLCPAHEDREPSLGVCAGERGIVLKCHAGCEPAAIAGAIGMKLADLFYKDDKPQAAKPKAKKSAPAAAPLSVADLAADKGIAEKHLARWGVVQAGDAVKIQYFLPDKTLAPRQRLRTAKKAKDGSRWLGKAEDGPIVPYGLQFLDRARTDGYVLLVEGESDCWSCWLHAVPALGIPGASASSTLQREHLEGIGRVYVWQEPDKAGAKFAHDLAEQLSGWGHEPKIVRIDGVKDLNELLQREGSGFRAALDAAIAAALPPPPPQAPPAAAPDPGLTETAAAMGILEDLQQRLTERRAWPEGCTIVPLLRHRDRFYRWAGRCWQTWEDHDARDAAMAYLQTHHPEMAKARHVSDVVANLGGLVGRPFEDERFDPPVWLSTSSPAGRFAVLENGILAIDELFAKGSSQALRPHTPDLFTLSALPYGFDSKAEAPAWQAFLDEVLPDRDLQSTLAEWFGYCLIPTQEMQTTLILVGEGANGKSVAVDVLCRLVGERNVSAVPLELLGERFALAPLVGRLVNISPEWGRISAAGEGLLKQIVAGDPVQVEEKLKNAFQTRLHARFTITSNSPPAVRDRSEGLWRRLVIIPFDRVIPVAKRRPKDELVDEICKDLPGILNWAMAGLERLLRRGRFVETEASADHKAEYRRETNSGRAFAEECLVLADVHTSTPKEDVYDAYLRWYKDERLRKGYELGPRQLGKDVVAWVRSHKPDLSSQDVHGQVRIGDGRPKVYRHVSICAAYSNAIGTLDEGVTVSPSQETLPR